MQRSWLNLGIIVGLAACLPLTLHAQTLRDPNDSQAVVTPPPATNAPQLLHDPNPPAPPKAAAKKNVKVAQIGKPVSPALPKNDTVTPAAIVVPNTNDISTPPKAVSKGNKLIVIDAGHGGPDSGTVGVNGHYEKNLTLTMAKQLREQLQAKGYKVALTRDTDVFIPLAQRVKIARNKKADLFVSLHANSMPEENSARGFSIYTLSDKASDETAARLAAKENKADLIGGVDLGNVPPAVSNILLDLTWRETNAHSIVLASDVVQSLKTSQIKTLDGPMRSAGFAVLKAPDMPSVLMEMGFLSNAIEEAQMFDPDHQSQLAKAMANGIDNFVKDALD